MKSFQRAALLLKIDFIKLDPPHDSEKNCDQLKGFVWAARTPDIKNRPKRQQTWPER